MSKYSKRPRDRAYLKWIRSLPCFLCATEFHVEAAHIGIRAFGRKCPDRETAPLCRWCHRTGPNSLHKIGKQFWSLYGFDRTELIRNFNEQYQKLREEAA